MEILGEEVVQEEEGLESGTKKEKRRARKKRKVWTRKKMKRERREGETGRVDGELRMRSQSKVSRTEKVARSTDKVKEMMLA